MAAGLAYSRTGGQIPQSATTSKTELSSYLVEHLIIFTLLRYFVSCRRICFIRRSFVQITHPVVAKIGSETSPDASQRKYELTLNLFPPPFSNSLFISFFRRPKWNSDAQPLSLPLLHLSCHAWLTHIIRVRSDFLNCNHYSHASM